MNPPENFIQKNTWLPSVESLFLLGSEWILLFAFILLALLAPRIGKKHPALLFWISVTAILFSAGWNALTWGMANVSHTGSMLVSDDIGRLFKFLFAGTSLFCLVLYYSSEKRKNSQPEFFPVWIAFLLGLNVMAMSRNLIMMVISLEMVSLSAYVLTGLGRKAAIGSEAALKYFIYGSFVTAISIYGISWIYGFTGTLDPASAAFAEGLNKVPAEGLLLIFVFLISAFAFKISAAPFHIWAPDVYQAVHWPIAAFFSVAPKAAGFLMLIRLIQPLQAEENLKNIIFAILAILFLMSLVIGNLAALRQKNLRRLLAFSGVAQSGFILLGMMSFQSPGFAAAAFYILVYAIMNLGLFSFVGWMEDETGTSDLDKASEYLPSSPWVLFAVVVFAAGLVGLPGTAGFTGKLSLFTALLSSRNGDMVSWLLFAFALLNILPALFYYLNLPAKWLFRRAEFKNKVQLHGLVSVVLSIMAFLVIWLGIFHFGRVISFLGILFEKIA